MQVLLNFPWPLGVQINLLWQSLWVLNVYCSVPQFFKEIEVCIIQGASVAQRAKALLS